MKLEHQITSLKLSKKLKELGLKQESLYFWEHWVRGCDIPACNCGQVHDHWTLERDDTGGIGNPRISAYTVAELGEMLPQYILKDGFSFELQIVRSSAWRLYYGPPSLEKSIKFTASTNDTEADSRAKMLIYIIENILI